MQISFLMCTPGSNESSRNQNKINFLWILPQIMKMSLYDYYDASFLALCFFVRPHASIRGHACQSVSHANVLTAQNDRVLQLSFHVAFYAFPFIYSVLYSFIRSLIHSFLHSSIHVDLGQSRKGRTYLCLIKLIWCHFWGQP